MKKTTHLLPILAVLLAVTGGAAWQKFQIPTWDPDAGYIAPWTENATATATSNLSTAEKILDGDPNTAWQSEAPLPDGFISRRDLNIFLGKKLTKANGQNLQNATDGNAASVADIKSSGQDTATIFIGTDKKLFSFSLKAAVNGPLVIYISEGKNKLIPVGRYSVTDNFQLKRFEIPGGQAERLLLVYAADFQLFELAALADLPTESVTVDLGQIRPIGQVHARHWAGGDNAVETLILLSSDGRNWQQVASLEPDILQNFITNLAPEIPARYLKIQHRLKANDWNKVFIWEVKAYDRFGPYGQMPVAIAGHSSLREMLGVNGYWSWGTDEYSDKLAQDGGPFRFVPVASHARNYHDLTWDLRSPSDPIDFEKMAKNGGTPATEWLNWDREYKAWNDAKLSVEASLQFYRFKPEDWKKPREDGKRYAEAFTRHFGLKNGNGQICTIEAGNEPWHYPAEIYREILLGMAVGAEKGDPSVEVFPCALQAVDPLAERIGPWKNYIGDRIAEPTSKLLDGINIHCYSYAFDKNGKRRAVQPEHVNSSFWEMLNAIRWRNQNMPGKKIYLSEWGWESEGGGEICTHDECVSEQAAADYAVRGVLIAARLGLDRATWFYYGNDKSGSSLYTRSGLVSSKNAGFAKKKNFYSLASLVKIMGRQYFLSVFREDEIGWVYFFGTPEGKVTHVVGWRPVDSDLDSRQTTWAKVGKMKPKSAWLLDGSANPIENSKAFTKFQNGELSILLQASPVVVELE